VDTTFWFDQEGKIYGYKLRNSDCAIDYFINDGTIKIFDRNGKIRMAGIVQNHKAGQEWTDYYKSGFVERYFSYKNDTGWLVKYYEIDKLRIAYLLWGKILK
jgi:antitoxin component YwqK of YwqJK toxin-antitoxin module